MTFTFLPLISAPPDPDRTNSQNIEVTLGLSFAIDASAYGAVGDGKTNDRAALQAAIDAAAAYNPPRTVILPRGNYAVGLAPGQDYCLKVYAGVCLRGENENSSIIKVKDSTGDYRSVIAADSITTDLTGFVLENLTVDQNNSGNPVTNQAALFAGYPRFAFVAGVGDNVTVRNCVFRNIDAVNTVVISGTAITDGMVTGCKFKNIGTSSASHDYSAIYMAGVGMTVSNNVFEGILGGNSSRTAIETHGPYQVIVGNRCNSWYKGANITGVLTATSSDNIQVVGNVFDNVLIGLDLWSYNGFRNCTIANNSITLERDSFLVTGADYPRGIMLDPTSTSDVENLKIIGNTITHNPTVAGATANELNAAGISLQTSSTTPVLRNCDVFDNTVIGALGAGLRLAMTTSRCRIERNTFIDCGSSAEVAMPAFYKSGIVLVGTLDNIIVQGNRSFDTRNPHVMQQGINTSLTAITNGIAGDNPIVCTGDGALLQEFVQTSGKLVLQKPTFGVSSRFTTGLYYWPEGGRSTIATTNQSMTMVPFFVSAGASFDRIGAEVTVAGAAATVVRLGIYADNGLGTPGALILDAGTIAGDAVAAAEITISQKLAAGLYWLAAVPQGGTPTMRCMATMGTYPTGASGLSNATAATPRMGFLQGSVSGALPNPFVSGGQSAAPVLVVLRAA